MSEDQISSLRKYLILATILLAGAIISLPILTTDAHTDPVSFTITEPLKFTKVVSRADEQFLVEQQNKDSDERARVGVDLVYRYFGSQAETAVAVLIAEDMPLDQEHIKLAWYIYKKYGWSGFASYDSGVYKELL